MTFKQKKPSKLSFWDVTKLSFFEIDLAINVEKAIPNKIYFIILYIIDPDLVVYGICKEIRENKLAYPGLPENLDMLEDVMGPVVEKIFNELFLRKGELNSGISELKNLIIARLSQNENQKHMNRMLKQRW